MTLSASPSSPQATVPRPENARALLLPGLALRAGDVIGGRFRLESLVSAEHALVHLAAESTAKHTKVDVLVLVGREAVDDATRLRFLAEARKCASLTSVHTARILHAGVTPEGHPFVVQERPPAQTLASMIEDGHAFEHERAVDIALDVCDALVEAHAASVHHGELGTHRVHLVWEDGAPSSVKLAGLATDHVLASLPLDATRRGPFVTRAPELLADRRAPANAATDVWGLGVVLYTMLAGAPPFAAESPSVLDVEMKSEEQVMLAGVPDALAELVESCLAKDPARRPATIAAVADALLPFASKPAESLARIVARGARPSAAMRASVAPSPELLAQTAPVPAVIVPPAALPTVRALPTAKPVPPPEPVDIGSETAPYRAVELEQLRAQVAKPAESELQIDIEVGPSVRDVSALDDDKPASHLSAPPVAITIPPPATASAVDEARKSEPALARAREHDAKSDAKIAATQSGADRRSAPAPKKRAGISWRTSGAMGAAACLAAGIVVGILLPRSTNESPAMDTAAATTVATALVPAAEPPPAATETLPIATETPAPAPPAPVVATDPTSFSVDALPAPKAAPAKAVAPKAAFAPKATAVKTAAPIARPTEPPRPAAAPPKPETKAHDDDLRRFLDDRR